MSDGFSTWDAIITLSFVLVPLALILWGWRTLSVAGLEPQRDLPNMCGRLDVYANPSRPWNCASSEAVIVRQHFPGGDCQCIHCRRGRTVIRATGPCGVH